MKLFIKLLMAALILAFGGLFFVKGPDGRPLMTWDKVKQEVSGLEGGSLERGWATVTQWWHSAEQSISGVFDATNDGDGNAPAGQDDQSITVYRWQDEEGVWHFSRRRPIQPDGPVSITEVSPAATTSLEAPEKIEGEALSDKGASQNGTDVTQSDGDAGIPFPTTVSPDEMTDLTDKAKRVQQTMDNRRKRLDKRLE